MKPKPILFSLHVEIKIYYNEVNLCFVLFLQGTTTSISTTTSSTTSTGKNGLRRVFKIKYTLITINSVRQITLEETVMEILI